MKSNSKNEQKIVNATVLSIYLGISERRIQQLSKEGIFQKIAHGQYDLLACIRAYTEHMRESVNRYKGRKKTYNSRRRVSRRIQFKPMVTKSNNFDYLKRRKRDEEV